MGTIIRQEGFAIAIYTHDHAPPHVHAKKAGKEARIEISENPMELENKGFSAFPKITICC